MSGFFVWFWAAMIFLSVAWYAVMLVYVGTKGGYEVAEMTRNLSKRPADEETGHRPDADEP